MLWEVKGLPLSGAVIRVDADVFVRKIAGIDGFGDVAAAQSDAHRNFGLFHDALAVGFLVVGVTFAPTGNQYVAQPQFGAADIQVVDAGIADGAKDAAQVGVGGEKGGLHEGRLGHGVGHLQGLFDIEGLLDPYSNEFGSALGVTHDFLGEFGGGVRQRPIQGFVLRVGFGLNAQRAGAGSRHNEGVIGRGVAVYGNPVERAVGDAPGHAFEQVWRDAGVGGQETQHGGHVGPYHARAFADTGDGNGLITDSHPLRNNLGLRV